ncbi:cold shock and DUF1294 domain-containing protein, partial [Anaerolineales bacterium HSG25]|nr:cold shock and DUF1294 domain-containing protein [Anaerolineales bacterium HSG25]
DKYKACNAYVKDSKNKRLSAEEPSIAWKKGVLTKWDDEKGFGFIQPLNKKEKQLFIHISGFRSDTMYRPLVGDVLYYQVVQDETTDKYKACNAYVKDSKNKRLSAEEPSIAWKKGVLTKWDDEKGFGFIQPLNKKEKQLFIHISGFRTDMARRPFVGDTLYYQITQHEATGKYRACKAHVRGVKDGDLERAKPHPFQAVVAQSLIIFPFGASLYLLWAVGNPFPLMMYAVMSVITTWLYYDDKNRAQQKRWRTPEYLIHFAELLGGWPGALFAQYNIRHKNSKFSYQIEFWIIVCLHGIWWAAYGMLLIAPFILR